jgi:hypothetical protein
MIVWVNRGADTEEMQPGNILAKANVYCFLEDVKLEMMVRELIAVYVIVAESAALRSTGMQWESSCYHNKRFSGLVRATRGSCL